MRGELPGRGPSRRLAGRAVPLAGLVGFAGLVTAVAVALSLPVPATAHAFLVRSDPASGARLARPPKRVLLVFDEGVQPAPGIAVIRKDGSSALGGRPFVPNGKPTEIVIPLRPHLARGDYTVRWREIDVDDGHLIVGVFAFAVGPGSSPPQAVVAAGGNGPSLVALVSRWLLLAGLLTAAGTAMFGWAVWAPVVTTARGALPGSSWVRVQAATLAAALAVAALGALLSVLAEPGAAATRFGRWSEIGAAVAAGTAVCSLFTPRLHRLRYPTAAAAVVLLALPTATGHAVAPGPPHAVSIPADLVHLAAGAFWIGGSLALLALVPLALRTVDPERRARCYAALIHRYSPFATAAVALLGASGVTRAVTELRSLSQLWTTGYGRTLLVKTGLLGALVLLGWLNRYRLAPLLAREQAGRAAVVLRRSIGIELALLAVVVGAVAVLTNLRPGRDYPAQAAAAGAGRQAVVLAREDGDLGIALALTPRGRSALGIRATVLGPQGPLSGLTLRFSVTSERIGRFVTAAPCGTGCYSATASATGRPTHLEVRVRGPHRPASTVGFTPPAVWPAPAAAAIVQRAAQTTSRLRTLVIHSRLASDPIHSLTTVYRVVRPNRLTYTNSDGTAAIIIGARRWDRAAGGRWIESAQEPIHQPIPYWPPRFEDAHLLRRTRIQGQPVWVVSFLDPTTPAWFTIWVDRKTHRTLRLTMIATAHFMHNRNGPFNAHIRIEPPR